MAIEFVQMLPRDAMSLRAIVGPVAQGCRVRIHAGRWCGFRGRVVAVYPHIPSHVCVRFESDSGRLTKTEDVVRVDDCSRVPE